MAEKATVFQTTQIGVEATAGTPVAANKKMGAVDIALQPQNESDVIRPQGLKYATGVAQNREYTNLNISGKPAFQDLAYLLSSLLHYTAPVQQAATPAYKWTFGSNVSAEDVGKTFTVEQGDTTNAWRVAGAKVSGLTLTFNNNNGVGISGSGVAKALEEGVTKTAGATLLNTTPISQTMVEISMADTQAGLAGETKYCRGFNLEYSLTDKFGLVFPIGCDPFTVEKAPTNTAKITVATDVNGRALIGKLRDGSTKWFRIKATGGLIDSTYYHSLIIDFPAKIAAIGDASDMDGLFVMEFGLQPVFDQTWGKAMNIELITDLSAL